MKRTMLTSLILLGFIAMVMSPAQAAIGIGASPAKIDIKRVPPGGTASAELKIYNPDNETTMQYAITSNDPAVSANPASDQIKPAGNVTSTITINPSREATEGNYSAELLINSTIGQKNGTAIIVPTIAVTVDYSVSGSPVNTLTPTSQIADWEIIVGGVVAGCAVVAGVIWKRGLNR